MTRPTHHLDETIHQTSFNLTVLVAGLGYFVDTFDFFLYNSMRIPSLHDLGLEGDALTRAGILILNCQILGALIGSFFWGTLGDRLGRRRMLLGSILIYSVGMILNGFVQDTHSYALIRFITGFGVAGEVGLGATLVAETVKSSKRTYALMFFTALGVLGVVTAAFCIEFITWRESCFIGGIIGLSLLFMRTLLLESGLFAQTAQTVLRRGSLKNLLGVPQNLKKYLLCIPILGTNFFVTGLILTLAPELAKATNMQDVIKANIALALYFSAALFGDLLGATLSEVLRSRRIVAGLFLSANALVAYSLLNSSNMRALQFYSLCAAFGVFNLWAISSTIVVEQFPTELRATASTSNFNCSRATIILMNIVLLVLKPALGLIHSLMFIGGSVFALGLVCVWLLHESYAKSLADE